MEYGWEGGTQNVLIETNTTWSIMSTLPSWLSVDIKSDTNLSITAESNDTRNARYGNIIISFMQQTDTICITQKTKERLSFVGEKSVFLEADETTFSVEIDKNVDFEVNYSGNDTTWISQTDNSLSKDFSSTGNIGDFLLTNNKISFKAKANISSTVRQGTIIIHNERYRLADTLQVYQTGNTGKYLDGEVIRLQQATQGNVNLVIMGDGFTKDDMKTGGPYESAIRKGFEYFFSIEPYQSYRDYFNVYAVVAESEESGVGEKGLMIGQKVNNKFGTAFGSGTEVTCDDDLVLEYALKVEELPAEQPLTVIVVLNSTKYAGTTYLYASGNSIALCPMSTEAPPNDFEGIIHHEAGGHGFGFLCDEYVYYEKELPDNEKKELKEWQELGYQLNADLSGDTASVRWKEFIGHEKYAPVGLFEGACLYRYGVWRCEENSCMNNNIPYFNVQSRWSIVQRIMQLSGKEFTVSDFMRDDFPVYPSSRDSRSAEGSKLPPLGHPVWTI